MTACQWSDNDDKPCPRSAHGDGKLCLWHNARVRKNDTYVIPLLEQELLLRNGSAVGFQLAGLIWPQAQLPGVILREANLSDCIMPGADLSNADLSDADLCRAQLSGAQLKGACLRNANLSGAHLGNADLRDADLRGATLDGTILLACDLRGADLSDALLDNFAWNRFTRFRGVRGFEPPRHSGSGDSSNEITVPFPSALAANSDHELSHTLLNSLGPVDPALSRTRTYRNLARSRSSVEAGEALVPRHTSPSASDSNAAARSAAGPSSAARSAAGPSSSAKPSAAKPSAAKANAGKPSAAPFHPSRMQRRWIALALLATLWATAASGLATWVFLRPSQNMASSTQTPPTFIDQRGSSGTRGSNDSSELYLRELQQREASLTQLRQANDELRRALEQQQQQLSLARVESVGLRDAADENLALRDQLRRAEQTVRQLGTQNRRLEETSTIIAAGSERLQQENASLSAKNEQRFAQLEEVTRFRRERDLARQELEESELQLAHVSTERDRLHEELRRSSSNLERFLTRLEGTRLEGLLQGGDERSPLLRITPGQPLVLGGDDLMLTLRVEAADSPGRVRVNAVIQRSDGRSIPDLSIVLYDERGQALRRMSFSFPAPTPGLPFASAMTEIDSPSFPTSARITAAQGIDDHLLSSQP